MKRFLRPLLLVQPVLVALVVFIAPLQASAASFNQNLIIDDQVFDNANSMSAGQIDNFLNGFTNSCLSTRNGFAAPDPTGYTPSGGYTYGGPVSAGQAIYDAAQAYGLNPQVLLVTLQKEQSLVRGDAGCSASRYAKAVGYGCPDSGGSYSYYYGSGGNLLTPIYYSNGNPVNAPSGTICVNGAAKVGFTEQIIHAAWMLRYHEQRSEGRTNWAVIKGTWNNSDDLQACYSGRMTQGTYKVCPNGNATFYDGYATIDNTSVHLDSGATAALYDYTPHFSGNQNFFNIFTSWFGGTTGPAYGANFVSTKFYSDSAYTNQLTNGTNYTLTPGQEVYARVEVANSGRITWDSNVHLGTANSRDRSSIFADNWLGTNRAAGMDQATVAQGQTASFSFAMKAPSTPGTYFESFDVVFDGQTWMNAPFTYTIDVSAPATPPSSYTKDVLTRGTKNTLTAGNYLLSGDGYNVLSLDGSGKLSLLNDFQSSWSPVGSGGTILVLQDDGNLVLYGNNGQPLWASNTNSGSTLALQSDGNLVLYNSTGQPVWASGTYNRQNHYNYTAWSLPHGSVVYPGQVLQTADRKYTFVLQNDGNLVLYSPRGAVWASHTYTGVALVMQNDGNMVLYSSTGRPVWSSNSFSNTLVNTYVQTDGNIVSYNAQGPIWASNTGGK